MRVVVAPDKFKGSLSAPDVAQALAEGLRSALPALEVVEAPVADGGEGTLDAAVAAGFLPVRVEVAGPTGQPLSSLLTVRGRTAVVEMAAASGLAVLPGGVRAPLTATSLGTGQLVRAALDRGCTEVVLAVGGSACTDGGAGLLVALGARLLDRDGRELGHGGGALLQLDRVDLSGLDSRLRDVRVVLASDVDNPLLGPDGAAAVYGPQKGADPDQVALLERGLQVWVEALGRALGPRAAVLAEQPGAGAAGGVGYAALVALDAVRRSGISVVLELVGFAGHVNSAALVITGEGSLDAQTLHGKAPAGVAAAARAAGVPVVAVAGQVSLGPDELRPAGIEAAYALTDLEPDPERCMRDARALLVRLGSSIAHDRLAAGAPPARTEGSA